MNLKPLKKTSCEDSTESTSKLDKTPISVRSSGLNQALVEDILARQLLESGVSDILELSSNTALSSRLIGVVLDIMRADARIEVLAPSSESQAIRYNLTKGGRQYAQGARERSGYIGPAPISTQSYIDLISRQSVRDIRVTRYEMQEAYNDVVIKPRLLDKLGAAMHSGKAMFVYGPAGTGKTFICSRLTRLLRTPVLIPYSIVVGDSIVRVFDPAVHTPINKNQETSAWLDERQDPRLVLCERPCIVSGGELTMDMLEIRRDPATRQYIAPLQMKAMHGIYMVDDLGRQKMSTDALFNRWIVPMESRVDYLNLDSGARLALPFDVILIFSTNMLPEDLDDPAFQRRVGHKIGFEYLDASDYAQIWNQECDRLGIQCSSEVLEFAINELHKRSNKPMLASHPRDLIGMSMDFARYSGEPERMTQEGLVLAWDNFFAKSIETDRQSSFLDLS